MMVLVSGRDGNVKDKSMEALKGVITHILLTSRMTRNGQIFVP